MNEFLEYVNQFHRTIKFTAEVSENEVSFLDTKVKLTSDGEIYTDLFVKPTDKSNYLHYKSAHPIHCKTAIPYGQFIRIDGICTKDSDFIRHCEDKTRHFIRRGYPENVIKKAYKKCVLKRKGRKENNEIKSDERKKDTEVNERTLFMITKYKPGYDTMEKTINRNWPLTQRSKNTRQLFDFKIMKVNRKAKCVKDHLVRARLDYHPTEGNEEALVPKGKKEIKGVKKSVCRNNCRVCPLLMRNGKMKSKNQKDRYTCNQI